MIQSDSEVSQSFSRKVAKATKWSLVTQLAMKLIGPVSTMLLARLLTPASFGIVASVTLVVSLAELVSDAGFQKYLIQHQFESDAEKDLCACVAFWTNFVISLSFVAGLFVVRNQLAYFVGSDGYGDVLSIASLTLPLASVVSVQTALFQKDLNFKELFGAGVGFSLVNFLVSIGLALIGFDYWSMIVGTIFATVFRAVWLSIKSKWHPKFQYSFTQLKRMFFYSVWVLAESAATWINNWAGTFIIGARVDQASVGYFKTTTTMGSGITSVITGAMMPVVFSTLSKLQDDDEQFERVFFKMQAYLALCVIPIGAGCFVYRRAVTLLLLGDQWLDTALFFGLWMLASCIVIVFGYMCSEVYRAKGIPRLCVIVQVIYLVPFLPALYISSGYGYGVLSVVVPAVRLILPGINLIVMKAFVGISPWAMLKNCKWYYIITLLAMLPGIIVLAITDSLIVEIVALAVSILLYVLLVLAIKPTRADVIELLERMGAGRLVPAKIKESK